MNPTLQQSSSAMFKTGIWDDEDFVESHSIEDCYLLFYLLTNPDRHLSGIIKINLRIISARTKWDRNQIQIVLDRLQKLGDVQIDGGFVWVKSYFDHNHLPSVTHFKQIRERLSEISESLRREWLLDAKDRGITEDLVGYRYPTDTLPGNNNDNGINKSNGNDNGIDKVNSNDNQEELVDDQGGEVVVDLVFPAALPGRIVDEIRALVARRPDAQPLLDELAALIEHPNERIRIRDPIAWVNKIQPGELRVTMAGTAIADARAKRKHVEAAQRQASRLEDDAGAQKVGLQMLGAECQKRAIAAGGSAASSR